MLPFSYPLSAFDGTKALEVFNEKVSAAKKKKGREEKGDELAPLPSDGFEPKDAAFASFGSLFQGDHLGVEFALASHEELLKREDLLLAHQRVRGHWLRVRLPLRMLALDCRGRWLMSWLLWPLWFR